MRITITLIAALVTTAASAQDVRTVGSVVGGGAKGLQIAQYGAQIAENVGVPIPEGVASTLSTVNDTTKVLTSVAAGGAAVASATTIGVAATSGAGIATGLAGAGSVVGAGMAAGPAVLAAGPAVVTSQVLNNTVFKDESGLTAQEGDARSAARIATNVGAAAGVTGVGVVVVAGGASGPAIMGTLAGVGAVVGGGALVGTVILVAAPVVAAGAAGDTVYWVWGGG